MLAGSRRRALLELRDEHSVVLALIGVLAPSSVCRSTRKLHTSRQYQTELRSRTDFISDSIERRNRKSSQNSWPVNEVFVPKCSFTKPESGRLINNDLTESDSLEGVSELLNSIRKANLEYPHRFATDLLKQLPPFTPNQSSDSSHSRAPPTPPPPISFLSNPRNPNPNVINALLLQAVVVGAGALGLLRRGKKEDTTEGLNVVMKKLDQEEIENKEREITATNLVISSWLIKSQIPAGAVVVERKFQNSVEAMESIRKQLHFIEFLKLKPNRWTVMAILGFIEPRFTSNGERLLGKMETKSKIIEIRPVLALWTWRAYLEIRRTEEANLEYQKMDKIILKEFILLFFDHHIKFDLETAEELLDGLYYLLALQHEPSPSMYLDLVRASLSLQLWSIPRRLFISKDSPSDKLTPTYRLMFYTEVLRTFAKNERYHGNGIAYKEVAVAISETVQHLSTVNECFGGDKKKRDSEKEGLIVLNSFHYREVRVVEEAMTLLMEGMDGQVALQSIMTSTILVILKHSSTSFSELFILAFLNWLVDSRNSSLAFTVFEAISPQSQTLNHHHILLRSSQASISARVWKQLLQSEHELTAESFNARLISHSHRSNLFLEEAREDLRMMEQMGIKRTTDIWNQILHLVGKAGSYRAFLRQWKRMVTANVELNDKTFNILMNTVNKLEKGIKQIKLLTRNINTLEKREIGRNGRSPIKATPITQNIIVGAMVRWKHEINSTVLVELVKRFLSIDLIDLGDTSIKYRWSVTPSKEHWKLVRRPLYSLLAKGFRNRGDLSRFRALIIERAAEKKRVFGMDYDETEEEEEDEQ